MSAQEDTLMSDINVIEDPQTPEPPGNTSTSSPIEGNRSSKQKGDVNDTESAMQGVVTEKGLNSTPFKKVVNPDTIDWLNSSSDVKVAKKATAQIYSTDTQKHEKICGVNNIDEKKPLKA